MTFMKTNIYKTVIFLASFVFFTSCVEKDIMIYENDPRIFFEIPGTGSVKLRDSLVFSFPSKPNVGASDTLWFKVNIMGLTSAKDREIGIKINSAKSTAVEGLNFKFASKVMPANAFSVRIPLVVYRAGLQNKSVRLEIEAVDNENFKVGYQRYSKAIFIWGDMFIKPDIWDTSNYKNAFGTFTEIRYAFILQACKITELPDPMNLVMLGYYNSVVREALYKYNSTPGNTPLTDELGAVGFPVWTGQGGVG